MVSDCYILHANSLDEQLKALKRTDVLDLMYDSNEDLYSHQETRGDVGVVEKVRLLLDIDSERGAEDEDGDCGEDDT